MRESRVCGITVDSRLRGNDRRENSGNFSKRVSPKIMKITLCGSIAFYSEMVKVQKKLENLGHEVKLPPIKIKDGEGKLISVEKYYEIRKKASDNEKWVWERKEEAIRNHFKKVEWSDAVLVLNYSKNGIPNYIGSNTFLEMGVAFYLKKKIFLLNPIPEISSKEEILGMKPIVLNGDLSLVKMK